VRKAANLIAERPSSDDCAELLALLGDDAWLAARDLDAGIAGQANSRKTQVL
jgi:hypothetical protein